MRHSIACLALAAAACLPAAAQNAADVEDLVGARAAGGETQLLARGYELRQNSQVRDQSYTFWWNARKGQCISVSTMDGRYAAITTVPAGNCDATPAAGSRPPASTERDPNSLVLVCYGGGTRPTVKSEDDYTWDHDSHKWKSETRTVSSTDSYSSDVQVELYGDHGRIHLGRDMVPPIHSGGSNGWWDLQNLSVTPDRITASYRLNGMNKPQVTIDRRSGRIDIRAVTNFSGHCDIGNYGGGARRF